MLMDSTGEPATAVGDEFVIHMDREALNDFPLGRYDVTVSITKYEQDRLIEWTIFGVIKPPIGHVYGYSLEPIDNGTMVTSYYDWSNIDPVWREREHLPDHPRGRPPRDARHPRPNRHRWQADAGSRNSRLKHRLPAAPSPEGAGTVE